MAPTPKPPAKPAPRSMGSIRMRAIRGPRADGRWYWRAERYVGGDSETVWTGWGSIDEADKAVAGCIAGVAAPSAGDCRTVRDLLSLWHGACEARGDILPTTIRCYGDAAVRLRDIIGPVAVDRLDRGTIERYRDQALRRPTTPRTVHKDLVILRLAWRWGRETGILPDRDLPAVQVRLPELVHPRVAPEDVTRILPQLRPAQRLHLLLLWSTGCRVSEIGALRRRDVEPGWISVTGKRRRRRIPLVPSVAADLATWMEEHPGADDGYVLCVQPQAERQMLHTQLKALGVVWTPHDLRRAAVDQLYSHGIDPSVAAALLGHSPQVAMQHYRRATEGDLMAGLRRAQLGRLTSPESRPPAPTRRYRRSR